MLAELEECQSKGIAQVPVVPIQAERDGWSTVSEEPSPGFHVTVTWALGTPQVTSQSESFGSLLSWPLPVSHSPHHQ